MTRNDNPSSTRRGFLKTGALAAGAAAASTLAAPAVVTAQSPRVIRMTTSWTASEPFQLMVQQYCDLVEAMSGGRLRMDLSSAGSIVGAFQVLDAVHDGLVDCANQVPVYWYGKHKGASLFGTGPVWGNSAANLLAWMHNGGGAEFYRELVQDILGLDIVSFFGFPMPAQPLGWFRNPVASADDLNGLKYRTVGLAADLFQAMGVAVTQLPGGEIVPAMERGVIDAFEYNNPSADRLFGAPDVAKNYMLSSYHQASEILCFDWNKDVYESLDDDLKAIVEYAASAAVPLNNGLALDSYSRDLLAMQEEQGVTVIRTPQDVLAKQIEAWDTLIPTFEEDDFMKRVIDSQRAWVERTVFYELMNAPDYALAYEHYFPGRLAL